MVVNTLASVLTFYSWQHSGDIHQLQNLIETKVMISVLPFK